MAVNYAASLAPTAVQFLAAGEAETVAFNVGAGSNRVLLVYVMWQEDGQTISGVTYNSVAMTALAAKTTQDGMSAQLWRLADPASGSNNIVVTMGAGGSDSNAQISAWSGDSADTAGTPFDGYTANSGNGTTANIVSSVTVSSATDDRVVVFHSTNNGSEIITAAPTNYTERQDADNGSGLASEFGDAAGAASIASSATWNNSAIPISWIALGVNVNASGGGGGGNPWYYNTQQQILCGR